MIDDKVVSSRFVLSQHNKSRRRPQLRQSVQIKLRVSIRDITLTADGEW